MPMMGPNSSRSTVNILFAIQYNLLRIVLRRILADLTIECRRVAHVLFIILGRASSADPQKQCAEKLQEDARDKEDEGQGEHAAVRRQVKMLSRKRIAARASVIQPNTEATRRIFNPPGVN